MTPWLAVAMAVIIFAGALFGYDQGVISGALHGIQATFGLSPILVEVVTSWVTLGALLGALAAGEMADRIGRKRTVLVAAALFTLASLVQAFAPDIIVLVAGRLFIGAGVGVAAVAAPLYAAVALPLMTGLPMSEINGFALPLNPDCLVKSGIRLPSQPLMWESGAARCCKVSRPCRRTSPRTIPLGRRLAAGRRRSASCSGAILSA
jgi:hypothetical protein